jgi:hypothetical protein
VSKNADVLATCLCPEGVEQWCYVNNTRAVGWARRSALTPYLIMGAAEAYCHQCDVRLNADGTTTPMVPAATAADITRERDEARRAAEWLAIRLVEHEAGCDSCAGGGSTECCALAAVERAYTSTGGTVPEQPAQSEPSDDVPPECVKPDHELYECPGDGLCPYCDEYAAAMSDMAPAPDEPAQ